uniref:trypsin n=1 Tax=Erpetoichthys calabaricus TaxID=27687 RepID=A0A8C4RXY7_ERPCA
MGTNAQRRTLGGASEDDIINGREAKGPRPYMASLQVNDAHVCGGFLIREDYVLTAAHCYKGRPLTVVLGAHNISRPEASQQKLPVIKYIKHGLNSLDIYGFDIMLLKVSADHKAILKGKVGLIRLPKTAEDIPANSRCSIAGWGKRKADGERSDDFLLARVSLLWTLMASAVMSLFFYSSLFCSQGDSGGPLVCNKVAQGMAIFTEPVCGGGKLPDVYLNIPSFIQWIHNKTNSE